MQGTSLQSFNNLGQVVYEEELSKEIVGARTMDDGQWAITKAHLE
jgi:hypothetical protein